MRVLGCGRRKKCARWYIVWWRLPAASCRIVGPKGAKYTCRRRGASACAFGAPDAWPKIIQHLFYTIYNIRDAYTFPPTARLISIYIWRHNADRWNVREYICGILGGLCASVEDAPHTKTHIHPHSDSLHAGQLAGQTAQTLGIEFPLCCWGRYMAANPQPKQPPKRSQMCIRNHAGSTV